LGGGGNLQLSVIAHTLRVTALGSLRVGDRVHVEADLIGKYVARLLAPYRKAQAT
jgi:riboflavin synthase